MRFPLLLSLLILSSRLLAAESIEIDFSHQGETFTPRASGFLHSITLSTPTTAQIAPLKPQLFRDRPIGQNSGVFALYSRLHPLGTKFQIVISDAYTNYQPPFPGDDNNWTRWGQHITDLLRRAKDQHMEIQWDIWNEPDGNYFWKPPIEQYLETWRRAHQLIRKLDPKATIVGPSLSNYKSKRLSLQQFLLYAKANDCLPDVLSWHDFTANFLPHVEEVKKLIDDNNIPITRFSLNEIVGPKEFTNPAVLPRYFANIHRAGIESAAHACWGEGAGVANCDNASLDGLLTNDTHQPRATWFTYAAYASMRGKIIPINATSTIDGLAAADSASATILLGRFKASDDPPQISLKNLISVPAFAKSKSLHIRVQRIPTSELKPANAPIEIPTPDRVLDNSSLTLDLPDFKLTDACFITVTVPK